MAAPPPVLMVHRATSEIGGNCIELTFDGHRLVLDAGSRLDTKGVTASGPAPPPTLDLVAPVDGLVITHPHQDHYGLLYDLPPYWPVWSGAASEILIRMTASLSGAVIKQQFHTYRSHETFAIGPFTITPYLIDHSAFDAHMLLVDVGGRRILYSGDFRCIGRKAALVDRLMANPPPDVDVLLLEGTTLGRTEEFPTESALEEDFVELFRRISGRVFVTWSGQNIDRTVTIYRACKKTGRTLVLDLYTIDVLEQLSTLYDRLPRLGWPLVRAVITSGMKRLYENPSKMNNRAFVERVATSGNAMGATSLGEMRNAVVMLRSSLLRDFINKGVLLNAEDAWVFSMWQGYLKMPEFQQVRTDFDDAGAAFAQIHTSGHAAREDLEAFAHRISPRYLVPIHSFDWDQHLDKFENVMRLRDGEPFAIPEA
jgi:ribonuclease J